MNHECLLVWILSIIIYASFRMHAVNRIAVFFYVVVYFLWYIAGMIEKSPEIKIKNILKLSTNCDDLVLYIPVVLSNVVSVLLGMQ